jgi:fibronectin-binding autotransporter adhesin
MIIIKGTRLKACATCRAQRKAIAIVCALFLVTGPAMAQAPVWGGAGSTTTTSDYGTATNWSGGGPAPTTAGTNAIFSSTGNTTVNLAAPYAPDSWTFNATSQAYTFTGTGVSLNTLLDDGASGQTITVNVPLGGAGAVTLRSGAGTLILNGGTNADNYSGATTINTGATLQAGGNGTFSANSDVTANTGGTLDLNGFSQEIGALNGAGLVTSSAAGNFNVGFGNTNASGSFSGVIQNGSATLGVVKRGSGTETLTGTNTYSGDTTVAGGTLKIGSAGALGNNNGVTILGGGTLDLNGFSLSLPSLVGGGTLTNSSTTNVTATLSGAGSDFSGVIQDGSAQTTVTVTATTQSLSGANTYTGITTINSGKVLNIGSAGTTGTLGTGAVTDNGRLTFARTDAITVANNISGGGAVSTNSGTVTLTGSNTYTGATSVGTGSTLKAGSAGAISTTSAFTVNGTLDVAGRDVSLVSLAGAGTITDSVAAGNNLTITGSSTTTFSGNIQNGTGSLGITLAGTGTLQLSGNNTGSGATIVTSGTLQAGSATAFNSNSAFTVNGTLDLFGQSVSIGSLVGSGTISNSNGPTGTLSIAGSTNSITTFDGVIQDGTGQVALTIANAGTTILTGANTYSGTTTINGGGTLQVGSAGTTGTLGSGTVTDTGTLTFNRSSNLIFGNTISGTGNVTQAGSGTTVLTAGNSYGTTTISSGILQIGNSGTTGTLGTGAVTDNALLLIARSDNITVSNAISGSGSLTQNASGTVILTGANSYGTSTITSGTLQVGNAGTTGTLGIGAVTDNAALVFNRTDSLTVANAISGAGTLTQAGTGTTILTGANSYATTTISAGTLQIGAGGTSGTLGSGAVTDNATLAFNRSDSITVANAITGTGTLTQAGSGSVILTGTNGYTTTTINSGSTLQVGSGGTTGSLGSGTVTDNGTLAFLRSNAVSLVTTVSGTGGLTQAGSGVLTIFAAQTYTGATNINAATTLALSGLGALTSSAVTDNGTFSITAITPATSTTIAGLAGSGIVTLGAKSLIISGGSGVFSGVIGGTGGVTIGGGNQIFSGANTYSGVTTINSGATLTLNQGGSVAGSITDNGLLAYAQSGTVTITNLGNVTGTGGLAQNGSGILIINTQVALTGISAVNNGTLVVGDATTPTASLAGGVNVASGATLKGHGTINGAVNVASGGTLRPGASIGTLTVNGATALPAGTTFSEEFSNTAFSKLSASGAVTLGGALQLVSTSTTYTSGTDYKFITGSSVSGTFSSVTGAVAGYTNTIQYSATAVDLILTAPAAAAITPAATPAATPPAPPAAPVVITTFLFGSYGKTPNQIAAGNGLTNGDYNATLYVALGNIVATNTAAVPATLGLLAGDIHASIRSAAIEDSRVIRNTVLNRLNDASIGPSVWGTVYGSNGSIATDNNAAALHHDASGAIIGADMPVNDDLRIGGAFAYNSTNASTFGKFSTAKGKMAHVIAYAGYSLDALDLKAGGTYDFGNLRIARTVANLNYSQGDSQTQTGAQAFASGGWKFATDNAMLEPYLGIAAVFASSGAFAESGAISALSGTSRTESETYATLGMKAALDGLTLDNAMPITPRIDLGWQHALNGFHPGQIVTFQNTGTSFTVLGVPLATDAAAVQLGLDLAIAPNVIFDIGYDGSFSSRVQNNAIRAAMDLKL